MLDTAAFTDLRSYIKMRITKAKYYIGNTGYNAVINDVAVLNNGTVRAQVSVIPSSTPVTITKVELYNSNGDLWAHQNCSITVKTGQAGILYWFDFTVTEEV